MTYRKTLLLFLVCIISCLSARTQTATPTRSPSGTGVQDIINSVDTLRSRIPAEKLYIQFDKPYYSVGDTMRLKAYLFDAAFLRGTEKSGIVYLELVNDTNEVFYRRMLPLGYGLGTGNIVLDKDEIPEGSYTLRAYTNLMRNFGEDLVFKKSFYVSGSSIRNWLVDSKTILSKQYGRDNLRTGLRFRQFNKEALRMHYLDIHVMEGKNVLFRNRLQTDAKGMLDVNFTLPEKTDPNNISIVAADRGVASRKITIPMLINRPENIDLQFMPEGGNLVNGIPSKVGFKAITEDGKGAEVSGKIYSGSQEVTAFNSSYKGMGSFELTAKEGESYTAKVVVNGTTKDFPLPAAKSNGTAIRVNNPIESDSIEVVISSGMLPANTAYYLIAQSRGIVCYGAIIRFNGSPLNKRKIAKSLFPSGIARFTIMSTDRQALNERITYIDHHDQLNITVKAGKGSYQKRDSIALAIEVKDHEGKPVEGSFSMSITDDNQVKADSLSNNILTSILLTNDLKGTVEEPGHYLQATEQAWKDLDHLLLTQGWLGYDWKDVFNPSVPQYAAEPEFAVNGRVSNVFNKGLAGTSILLLSSKPSFIMTGNTAKDGSFSFSGFPNVDTLRSFIKAANKNGKSFNVGIDVDEFTPQVFKKDDQRFIPWNVNSDTTLLRQVFTKAVQDGKISTDGTNLLEEVVITEKKAVRDSKNLNGPGGADQILDEKDMKNGAKKTLLDLMHEKITGFNIGIWPGLSTPPEGIPQRAQVNRPERDRTIPSFAANFGNALVFAPTTSYKIAEKEMHLIIDGVDVESFYVPTWGPPYYTSNPQLIRQDQLDPGGNYILERNTASKTDRMYFIKQFLESITAEDIKGIEVMSNPKYNSRYKWEHYGKYPLSVSMIGPDFAFVEVTTYSGNGAYMKKIPGGYLFRPMPFANSAAFYRPRYINKTSPVKDLRSTIHWESDIVTDKEGKALVSFYSADSPGTYSIIMEGSDMDGNIGRKTGVINVEK